MEDKYFNVFGLNAPAWSLFWEYIANIVYSLILVRLSRNFSAILTVIAAITLFAVAGIYGSTSGGWDGSTFWHGGARIFYSFLAGMCIFRFNLIIKNKLGFPALTVMLILAFFVPWNKDWNWLTEPLIITLYFPLIIMLGAGSLLKPSQQKICNFSGRISYPLYITHYFAMWSFGTYYATAKPSTETLLVVIPIIIAVQLVVAYASMKFYDLPIRKWLMKK